MVNYLYIAVAGYAVGLIVGELVGPFGLRDFLTSRKRPVREDNSRMWRE